AAAQGRRRREDSNKGRRYRAHGRGPHGQSEGRAAARREGRPRQCAGRPARQGSLEAAKVLVDAGADKEARDPDLSTPAILATINEHYDVAAMLVERGADPNLADTSGMAVLYAAVDMDMPAEIYGRPNRKSTSTISALDLMKV